MLNILITGARGQLGSSLRQLGSVSPNNYLATDVAELDITDAGAVLQTVKEQRIDVIVNCAAYTNVERAEEDEPTADLLNHKAAAYLAAAAKETGATLIHVSTDYVFDGTGHRPYTEDMATSPLGAYGRTKLAGEEAVKASGCRYLILRTAWLYSEYGNNFLKTMLRLTSERETLRVVFDQVGTPTYAGDLALEVGVVLEGSSAVNESALTGESIPVDKAEGDSVSAATLNQSGFLRCRATRVGQDTTLAQIIQMVSDAAATKAPIAKIADRVSGG